ncbi:hypothetical protein [Pectobacterium brasiliense]|uniref:hypothetical protein n=1 Tax=Pectobacterium brasiliense TaxID=180957 RepID=UPI000583EEFF|nr:hypothetical protein [Pectobacterium brasiliense]KHT18289.1 hypothetical protein RC97_11770 [Pectobacterium brasiliense]
MMKYFRWDFLKKHVGITHLIAFSLGVIVICFLDALVFEKSIADWVSSTANVVMAGAALYAAWNAKDWFSRRMSENSFNKADDIIQQVDNLRIKSKTDLWIAMGFINGFRNNDSASIYESIDHYNMHIDDVNKISSIRRKITRIKTLGIIVNKENVLIDALQALDDFYSGLLVIYRYQDEITREIQTIDTHIYHEAVSKVQSLFKKIDSTSNILFNTNFNEIFGSKY